jgi:hypothetical protein
MPTKILFTIIYCFLLPLVFLLASCKKNKIDIPVVPPPVKKVHVYVSGYDYANNHVYAKYWKDSTGFILSDTSASAIQEQVNAITVTPDSVVHMAGSVFNLPYPSMVYWENSTPVSINNYSLTNATGIAVSVNNVYISGTASDAMLTKATAEYWQNGILTPLYNGNAFSYANAIAVSGVDVYTAWNVRSTNGNYIAKYSKNTASVSLSDSAVDASANAITVAGSDVYVAGYVANSANTNSNAVYWKNGVQVTLSGGIGATATGIFFSGSDVYVCGQEYDNAGNSIAKYWKNGVAITLGNPGTFSYATGIAVSGSDVYVSGYQTSRANYWKNGISVNLPAASSTAHTTGIVIQ